VNNSGQSIQLFGNITGGIQYDVDVDGNISTGSPSGQILASISGLQQGTHTVSLAVTTSGQGSSSLLSVVGATVTVGTGLTG
jgi:hypothetical protein